MRTRGSSRLDGVKIILVLAVVLAGFVFLGLWLTSGEPEARDEDGRKEVVVAPPEIEAILSCEPRFHRPNHSK